MPRKWWPTLANTAVLPCPRRSGWKGALLMFFNCARQKTFGFSPALSPSRAWLAGVECHRVEYCVLKFYSFLLHPFDHPLVSIPYFYHLQFMSIFTLSPLLISTLFNPVCFRTGNSKLNLKSRLQSLCLFVNVGTSTTQGPFTMKESGALSLLGNPALPSPWRAPCAMTNPRALSPVRGIGHICMRTPRTQSSSLLCSRLPT